MAGRHNDVQVLAGEDVSELASLLLEPRDGLRVGDLALAIGYLLRQRRVARDKRAHLGVEVPALRDLTVDRERHEPADPRDEHDGNPSQRDGAVERRTLR